MPSGPPEELRNIVLVTFDSLRADHLSSFGQPLETSPYLDAFASRSTTFTNVLSQSATTPLSLKSFFYSRYPFSDHPDSSFQAPESFTALLNRHDYETAAVIGHWAASSQFGFHHDFDRFEEKPQQTVTQWMERGNETRERAIAVLSELRSPFFLWVHFQPPHCPYPSSIEAFARFYPEWETPNLQDHAISELAVHYAGDESNAVYSVCDVELALPEKIVTQLRAKYAASIRTIDGEFGNLIEWMREAKLLDDTIVVVAADHGESLGDHMRIGHNEMYQSMLHVPVIMRIPGRAPAVVDVPVMNIDVLPTVAALLGIDVEQWQPRGQNVLDFVPEDRIQYAEYSHKRTVKQGPWKLIQRQKKAHLYDLRVDPSELEDIASDHPDVVAQLLQFANRIRPLQALPSETYERLIELGYILD